MSQSNTIVTAFRWIGVLPAAIGAYFAIQIVVAIANTGALWGLPEEGRDIICQLLNSFAGPVCLVYVGAKTAPRYQFPTAIVLTVLHAVFSGAVMAMAFVNPRFSGSFPWLVACGTLAIVSTIIVCLFLYSEERQSGRLRP